MLESYILTLKVEVGLDVGGVFKLFIEKICVSTTLLLSIKSFKKNFWFSIEYLYLLLI